MLPPIVCSAIESIFRSLNNLLERFHASFFLYIMTSIVSFVTVGSYLAAPVLISAGMSIQGMSLWAHCCRKGSSSTGKQLRISSLVMKNRVKTSEVFGVVAATHVIGGCIFFVLTSVDPRDPVPVRRSPFARLMLQNPIDLSADGPLHTFSVVRRLYSIHFCWQLPHFLFSSPSFSHHLVPPFQHWRPFLGCSSRSAYYQLAW